MNNSLVNKNKNKGVIRKGFLSLLVILSLLIGLYFTFLFDSHVKWVLMRSLRNANCAQVDIQSFTTKFKTLKLQVKGLEISDYSHPDKNLLEIKDFNLRLNWDAILRSKILIEDSTLSGLLFNASRKAQASIYPKCKENQKGKLDLTGKLKGEKDKLLKGNVLESVISILKGNGNIVDRIKAIKLDLKSPSIIEEKKKLLEDKKSQWEGDIAKLKDLSQVQAILNDAKKLKISKKPAELLQEFNKFKTLKKQADEKINEYKRSVASLRKDIKSVSNIPKEIESSIALDKNYMKKYLNIPNLNVSEISQSVFGNYIEALIAPYMLYWHQFKEYIPQSNVDEAKELTPHERAKGISVHYPIKRGYPKIWLKELNLDAFAYLNKSDKGSVGFKGFIKNFSSDERMVGSPMTFQIDGDLPQEKIDGVSVKGTVKKNYDTGKYLADVAGSVRSFPIKELRLSKSEKFKLTLKKAIATTNFSGVLGDEDGKIKLVSNLEDVNWLFETKEPQVNKILSKVLDDIPKLSLKSLFSGSYFRPKIRISSDFDMKFKQGISNFISTKVSEAKKKASLFVDEKVQEQKKNLFSKLSKDQADLLKPLGESELKISSLSNAFTKIRKDFEEAQKNKLKNKALDEIKKKIKLPF